MAFRDLHDISDVVIKIKLGKKASKQQRKKSNVMK